MTITRQIGKTESLRVDGQLADGTASDRAGCGNNRTSTAGADQVESFGFVFVFGDPLDQRQHIMDTLHEERIVVTVGVSRRFSRVRNDLLLSKRLATAEELSLPEQICGNH